MALFSLFNSESEMVNVPSLPCILDGKFFIFSPTESTDTKRVGICVSCLPKEVRISGFNNSTSNFVTHLKRKHGEQKCTEYQSYLKSLKKVRQPSRASNSSTVVRPTEIEDRIEHAERRVQEVQEALTGPQEQFNENMVKFFINSMIPLHLIDDQFFKKIFECLDITARGLNLFGKETLGRLIDEYYVKEIKNIKSELQGVKDICTTADVWSGKRLSFLGVTAHWLDSNLQRKSKSLAFRRVSSSYEHALVLETVHTEFGLNSRKVVITVTDKSSNYGRAFKVFGIDMTSCVNFTNNMEENTSNALNEVDPLDYVDNNPQLTMLEIPEHLTCPAVKLNLCATDANKLFQNNEKTVIHKDVINKCNNLWDISSCPKSAEILRSLGHTLSKPDITRWNSLYDALNQIASIQENSAELYNAMETLNVLLADDFQYINEYLRISKPIAEALDILQGEHNMYYGVLLPCLVSLRKKLQKLKGETFVFWKDLADIYLESVEERFAEYFDVSSKTAQKAAVAAISYPRFKDKWITCVDAEHQSRIRSIFKRAVMKEIDEGPKKNPITPNTNEDSFFEFDTDLPEKKDNVRRTNADDIISNYLADQDRDVFMLNRYPEIRSVFQKYNTPLPASSPVDKLFSYATMNSHLHNGDEMFEKRVLLKSHLSCT